MRQSVRAESVQASDFQSAYETKDSYDWYQTSAGTATASGTLPVVDACPCNSDGFRAASARMLRLEFSPVKQDANVVGSVFRFDPVQHTTSWCSDYTLSIQLSKDASLSAALFGLPVTKVEVNPAIDFSRARIPALDPFRLDGKFTGSDGRTLLYASYEPSGAVEVPLVVWLHSGEECGSDVRIPLLAEKVSALAGKAFQDALGGSAFVLVPQTSEVWDDAQVLTLRELIEQFAAEHPNLDRTRIYLGGSPRTFSRRHSPSARLARTRPFRKHRSRHCPKRRSGSPMQKTGSPPTPASTPLQPFAGCSGSMRRSDRPRGSRHRSRP